jgi:hypothetical protein
MRRIPTTPKPVIRALGPGLEALNVKTIFSKTIRVSRINSTKNLAECKFSGISRR